jgi:kynureninase
MTTSDSQVDLGPYPQASGYTEAVELDAADSLAGFRDRFAFDDPDLIYLDGNSLGRLPLMAVDAADRVVAEEWGDRLIRSWNERWWDLPLELGDKLAPIVGAGTGEVIISDSTSVNLYKLAMAAMQAMPDRSRIVTDDLNFPTDVYVLRGVASAHGAHLDIVAATAPEHQGEAIAAAIGTDTALVSLSLTTFKTGYTYDLADVTAKAHEAGALVLWDLSHAAGVVPIDLAAAGADLAVGCTYKYLNGGPGSPAFLYVRRDLQPSLVNPITAWWGHAEPFAFDLEFRPIDGIRRFHTGTMPILSMSTIDAGISAILEAGVTELRQKSISLGEFLVAQWQEHLEPLGFGLASPRDPRLRGSHVALTHDQAWAIARALIEIGKVIPDFRAPHNLRFGLAPLYVSHLDVHTAVQRSRLIVEQGLARDFGANRLTVT